MKKSEHDEQKAVIQWADAMSGKYPCLRWLHAIPNAAKRSYKLAAYMKAEGMKSGVFDLCLPYPCNGYHGLYIEMKAGNGRVSENQQAFEAYAAEQGYCAVICWGADAAIEAISEYISANDAESVERVLRERI